MKAEKKEDRYKENTATLHAVISPTASTHPHEADKRVDPQRFFGDARRRRRRFERDWTLERRYDPRKPLTIAILNED